MDRRGRLGAVGLALAASVLPGTVHAEEHSGSPNILFILTDDQGWSDFSEAYDPSRPDSMCGFFHTPHMNLLARQGVRFTDAYAPAPVCTPTRRSLLYGMTPARQRGTEFLGGFDGVGHLSIADYLKRADDSYRCAVFGKWGEVMSGIWTEQNRTIYPGALGFDESDGRNTGNVTGTFYNYNPETKEHERNYRCEADPDPKLTFSVTGRAISFMERQVEAERPFYLQVNYYAIHTAHLALQETMDRYADKPDPDRKVLRGVGPMLEDLDTAVGRLMRALDDLGVADNTYVFYSSDNGGEKAYVALPEGSEGLPDRNVPLRGVKGQLYEGGVRVPLIVRGPGVLAGGVCREPVVLYDLLATFYDLAGGDGALPDDIDGGSFAALLEDPDGGGVERPAPGLIFHRPLWRRHAHSAIRMGDHKLVVTWSGPWEIERTELFNLADDIGETSNLAERDPERTEAMTEALLAYLRDVDAETAK